MLSNVFGTDAQIALAWICIEKKDCCVFTAQTYLQLANYVINMLCNLARWIPKLGVIQRYERKKSDMMGIDESVALKAVNNGPFFCFVLFCRTAEARITNCGCCFIKLANLRIFVIFHEYLPKSEL